MRVSKVYIDGIPHWTDGILSLPIIAGGHKGTDNFAHHNLGDPGGDEDTSTKELPADRVIRTWDHLHALLPDYSSSSLAQILGSSLFNGKMGYTFAPKFFQEFQNVMLKLEAGSGYTPSSQPAEVYGSSTSMSGVLDAINQQGTGSYSSTAASQAQAEAFAAAEAEKARAFQAEQDRLAREEQQRQSLLSTAQRLLEGRQGVRQRVREQRVELAGNDPFRFTAALHGVDAGDTATPYDQFKSNLANITANPLPTLNPSGGVAEIQGVVDKLKQMEAEENNYAPSPFVGMAGGGTLPPPGSAMGAPMNNGQASFGGRGYGVLVGDGQMNGDEEVVIRRPDGSVEVVPLAGRSDQGSVLPLPNLTVFPDLFKNLRSDMFKTYGGGAYGSRPDASDVQANYSALGFRSPFGDKGGGNSFQPRFGQGLGQLAAPLSIEKGLLEAGTDPATAASISAQIGTLPNPRNAAVFLSRLPPTERQAVLSLYRLAGVPDADFDNLVASASAPAGQARQSLSYG